MRQSHETGGVQRGVRVWVEPWRNGNALELGVERGLHKLVGGAVGAGVVRNEVQLEAVCRLNGKGLLHQAVRLVAKAVRAACNDAEICIVAAAGIVVARVLRAVRALALHLAVRQKGARHARRAPRLAVCPAAHASFPLVPHKDGARCDCLSFLLREPSLDPRQNAQSAGLKEIDGV